MYIIYMTSNRLIYNSPEVHEPNYVHLTCVYSDFNHFVVSKMNTQTHIYMYNEQKVANPLLPVEEGQTPSVSLPLR